MIEFIGLREKSHAYLMDDVVSIKKLKEQRSV